MQFNSPLFFWSFLPCVIFISFIIKSKYSNMLILAASLFFYAWNSPSDFALLLFLIVMNWFIGICMGKIQKYKKIFLMTGLCGNLSILLFFKYYNSIVSLILAPELKIVNILLPLGISFITFRSISYILDVFWEKCETQSNIFELALYLSFFPQLISGPIEKYHNFELQLVNRLMNVENMILGVQRFSYGLAKKVLVANYLEEGFDILFQKDFALFSCGEAWMGALLYSLQIYYDFSGYSDMAIGVGKMLGFNTIENFNYPYIASSVRDFWRRWHISLSTWFRDYVYIPLGGSRKGKRRTYSNIFIVFLLTGLWHGATSNFVIWGLYYAFFLVIERAGFEKILNRHSVIAHIYSVVVILFGWVIFKISNITDIAIYFKHMLCPWKYGWYPQQFVWNISVKTVIITIVALLGCGVIQTFIAKYCKMKARWNKGIGSPVFCGFIMFLCIIELSNNTYYPFIYFNF